VALTSTERSKRWREAHPEYHREKAKKWNAEHHEQRLASVRKWKQENPERVREMRRKSHAKIASQLRKEAIALLGDQCIQCQCSDVRCLQIDHIIPLRGKQRLITASFYRSIIQGLTENLQILCANCHAIKTYYENGGEDG
jgi:5-methylcytosine-specific restriction endonuclease McrA